MTNETKTYEPLPEGELKGRVVHVVRAGKHTQRNDRFNKGATPRLWITYEFPEEKNEEGKPRWMSYSPYGEPINSFFTELGKQAEWLKALGHRTNSEESLKAAAGQPVWVEVEHNTSPKNGKTYANIVDVSKVRDRDLGEFPDYDTFNPVYFDIYNPEEEAFRALPLWIKEYCLAAEDEGLEKTKELMQSWMKDTGNAPSSGKPAPTKKSKPVEEDPFEDDVPF